MNGPRSYPGAATAATNVPRPPDTEQLDIYAVSLRDAARDRGLTRAQQGDPEAFARCVTAIRRTAHLLVTWTSDDVHMDTHLVMPGPELGSAFRYLSQAGEIEPCGFEQSKRPESHGRVVRVWTATSGLRDWSEP